MSSPITSRPGSEIDLPSGSQPQSPVGTPPASSALGSKSGSDFGSKIPAPSSRLARLGEWIFRGRALHAARSSRTTVRPSPAYQRAGDQARLLVEVARRVAEPVEALPKGARPAVLATLYRDAIFWGLQAERLGQGLPAQPNLEQLWEVTAPDRLLRAAGDEQAALAAVRSTVLERSASEAVETTTGEDAARARAFADTLLWDLEAPTRAVERLQVQRWTRITLVAAALLLTVLGTRLLLRGSNLVKTRVFKTSTSYPGCTPPNQCGEIFFHTEHQNNAWIDFDLGSVKNVRQVEVTNRSDCCSDRAVPLIVEVSVDDKQWIQVAKRDTDFSFWKATFPKQKARYVRFRVPRVTALHFDDLAVR